MVQCLGIALQPTCWACWPAAHAVLQSFIFQLWSSADSAPDDPLPLSGPEASLALTPLVPGGFRTNQRAVQVRGECFHKVRLVGVTKESWD